ncbi:MAG: hypothetical protein EU530_01005 [Promethearchaeota archaeon]|nr:MAG: hypothetical protein EU530_01005 [Candidatus Lokiarchaeota archaeon]
MQKKRITYIFLLVGLLGILNTIWAVDFKNNSQSPILNVPYSAELSNSTITYTDEVQRVVESFDVKLNLTTTFTQATEVNITITYINATVETYTLSEDITDVWYFSTYFAHNAPLGTSTFQLFVYNGLLLLDDSYVQPFEIINSAPQIAINILNNTVYRNGFVFFNVTPSDAETPFYDLTWSWEINFGIVTINSSTSPKLTNLSHFFPISTLNTRLGQYVIKCIVSDDDGGSTTTYGYFTLKNNAPIITDYEVTFPDVLNPDQILRETEEFILSVNVSDVEVLPENINLRVKLTDELGTIYWRSSSMERSTLWNFEGNISVLDNYRLGEYTCTIEAYEVIATIDYNTSTSFTFIVGNNLPDGQKITYTINGNIPTTSGLRIKEFEDIMFTVNVTNVDIEGIEFIRIHLISPEGKEYIYPFLNNEDDYMEYTLSAKDLAYGQWITWIYVVDFDGAEVHSLLSYSFDILPERFTSYLPWIMLVIGAVIAFGVSMAVLGTRYITLRRNFDNLLSRSGDYIKQEVKTSKAISQTPKPTPTEKTESSEPTTSTKKSSPTKKHELFRKIKKK